MKHDDNGTHRCACSPTTGFFIRNRELSLYCALCFIALFFVFMAGFFLGKQQAIKDFLKSVDHHSFSDHVSFSLYSLNNCDNNERDTREDREVAREIVEIDPDNPDNPENSENSDISYSDSNEDNNYYGNEENKEDNKADNSAESSVESSIESDDTCDMPVSRVLPHERYYAQLIGFGTAAAAEQFAHHIAKRGFSVKVKKRRSRTAKGKVIWWYQVVTDSYRDKECLKKIVDVLMRQEKLRDVRIVTSVQ